MFHSWPALWRCFPEPNSSFALSVSDGDNLVHSNTTVNRRIEDSPFFNEKSAIIALFLGTAGLTIELGFSHFVEPERHPTTPAKP